MKTESLKDFKGHDLGITMIEVPGGTLYSAANGLAFVPEPGPSNSTQVALVEVMRERGRQDAQWGGPEHDDEHKAGDWFGFIIEQHALWQRGAGSSRERLTKIAALAVAGLESIDRKAARQ